MGRDVAEKVQRMGRKAGLVPSGLNRASAQAPRIIEPGEQQTSTPHRVVGPAAIADDSLRRLALQMLLALPDPLQGLARFANLRQHPRGRGDRPGKLDGYVSALKHRDPALYQ